MHIIIGMSPKARIMIKARSLLDLLFGPQLQEMKLKCSEIFHTTENFQSCPIKENILKIFKKHLIAVATFLLPAIYSPGMQTSITSNNPKPY